MEFGKRLHELRTAKWLTLETLAKKVGTSKGYLSGVENAMVRPPTDRMVRKLAKFFGVDAVELLRLAYAEKLPLELREEYRKAFLAKPPAQ